MKYHELYKLSLSTTKSHNSWSKLGTSRALDSNRCIVGATCGDAGRAIVGGLRRISKATANVAGSPVLSFSFPFSFSSSRCIFLRNREYSTNDSPAKLRHACKLSRASNSVSHRDGGRGRVDLGFSRRAATAKVRDANSLICKLMTAWLSRRRKLHRRALLTLIIAAASRWKTKVVGGLLKPPRAIIAGGFLRKIDP